MTMRRGLLILGIIAALTGLVWIGQGTGYFPYPENSFMVRAMVRIPWPFL